MQQLEDQVALAQRSLEEARTGHQDAEQKAGEISRQLDALRETSDLDSAIQRKENCLRQEQQQQEDNKDQQQPPQQDQQQNNQQQQQQQSMSQENIDQILKAMQDAEQSTQQRVNAKKAEEEERRAGARTDKNW